MLGLSLFLAALLALASAVPCPFNEEECTCAMSSNYVYNGKCNFKTGSTPNFPKAFNGYITGFSMQHTNDMSLPDNTFQNVKKLADLRVQNTTITTIGEKSFAGLKGLTTLYFDRFTDENLNQMRKPLADLPQLNQFYLEKSAFKTVDLADFSESTSRDLDVYFKKIDTVTYTNTEKFVYDLEFKAYSATIDNIDKSVGDLLAKERRARILLGGSKLGACENFDWMATAKCNYQIETYSVTCVKNGAKVALSKHLRGISEPNKRSCWY